jgi:hypothetical protein
MQICRHADMQLVVRVEVSSQVYTRKGNLLGHLSEYFGFYASIVNSRMIIEQGISHTNRLLLHDMIPITYLVYLAL